MCHPTKLVVSGHLYARLVAIGMGMVDPTPVVRLQKRYGLQTQLSSLSLQPEAFRSAAAAGHDSILNRRYSSSGLDYRFFMIIKRNEVKIKQALISFESA
jgi:hypothetical protein